MHQPREEGKRGERGMWVFEIVEIQGGGEGGEEKIMDSIKPCKICGTDTMHTFKERPDTVHGGELRCSICGTFWGWLKKEKNEGKRPPNKYSPKDLGIDYCQMCLRSRARLGTHEILLPHHIIEINGPDKGEDIPENIWVVCSACHVLIHYVRTYLHNHFKSLWDAAEGNGEDDLENQDPPPPPWVQPE
jgi:hypothetical protein